ncbi:MAG: ABC transporter permease [Spirochaeta sp.]
MRRFTSLLGQDLVLAWRNGHILVIAFMMIVMAAIILLVPAEISSGPGEYILDSIPGRPLAEALLQQDARPEAVVAHQEELDQRLQENEDAIGIIVTGSIASPEIEIQLTRPVPDRTVNLLKASIDMVLAQLQEQEAPGSTNQSSVTVQRIRPQAEPVPLNLTGVPIFLAFEVGILGFLLVAVFVFQEKQEGTIRAYRVTPAGLWPYIASKTAVFTMLGIIYGFGVVLVGFGIDFNALALLGLIVYGSVFMTLFGLGFAAWFHNLSHWFFPGLAVLILNMLPFFSYIYPVFNPVWIQAIPSYGLVYALRETLFPTGDSLIVIETLGWGLIWIAGAAIFAGLSVQKKLLKGG